MEEERWKQQGRNTARPWQGHGESQMDRIFQILYQSPMATPSDDIDLENEVGENREPNQRTDPAKPRITEAQYGPMS